MNMLLHLHENGRGPVLIAAF